MRIIKIKVGNKILKIKDCKFSSARGLMFDDMKNYDGALIYGNSVWMPFVKHELDLIFLDKNFIVFEIQKAVPITMNRKTWKVHKNKKAKYCLEIKSGLVKLRKGTRIQFQ